MIMRFNYKVFFHDRFFLVVIAALAFSGLFFLSSASVAFSHRLYGTISYIAFRQALSLCIGAGLFFFIQLLPLTFWKRVALPFLLFSLLLLIAVLSPNVGLELQGARRWIHVAFFTFQPSEVAKLGLILFLAWWFDRQKDKVSSYRYGLIPFIGIISLVGILVVLEPDLGTLGVIVGTVFLMFFVGGGKVSHIAVLLLIGIVALVILAHLAPYRLDRLTVFLNPETDPQGIGYQARQAGIAIGSGGFWGVGYGASREKYDYIPEPIGDSIFAIVAEEFGFLGAGILIILFLLLLWRCIVIARSTSDVFSKLLVTGIASSILFQAFINIAAISGLMPLTGIPLPFISYGGTALIITFLGLGIIYRVAK